MVLESVTDKAKPSVRVGRKAAGFAGFPELSISWEGGDGFLTALTMKPNKFFNKEEGK